MTETLPAPNKSAPINPTIPVDLYPSAFRESEGVAVDLLKILEQVKAGRWADQVAHVRSLLKHTTDSHHKANAEYEQAKKTLPCYTPGGTAVGKRGKANMNILSGIFCLDIDVPGVARQTLMQDPHVFCLHKSAGGTGWAVYVRIQAKTVAEHEAHMEPLQRYFKSRMRIDVDTSGRDASRLRYVSHDPQLYLNQNSKVFIPSGPAKEAIDRAFAELERRKIDLLDGAYDNMLRLALGLIDEFGPDDAKPFFDRLIALSPKYSFERTPKEIARRWKEFCAQAQATAEGKRGGTGIKVSMGTFWHMVRGKGIVAKQPWKTDAEKAVRDYLEEMGDEEGAIQLLRSEPHSLDDRHARALYLKVLNAPADVKVAAFWAVSEDEKGNKKLTFRPALFIDFLHNSGYWCYQETGEAKYRRVRVSENVIYPVQDADLKHNILAYLEGLPYKLDGVDRPFLLDQFYKQLRTLFHPEILETLPVLKPVELLDTPTTAYFCYLNGWVAINGQGETHLRPYEDLPAHVHEGSLIQRSHQPGGADVCDFATFAFRCAGQDDDRYRSVCSGLGYLLHRYKSPAITKVIILQDEIMEEGAEMGGTGKGLLIKAVSQLRDTVIEPGKQLDLTKSFAFQLVRPTTAVFCIDDPTKRFAFSELFNLASEGMKVEKKNRDAFHLPYERSPKLAMTVNHALAGMGGSHRRRRFEIEVSGYYNANHTPKDEFGKVFFGSDWVAKDWADFDALMFACCQTYLREGLIEFKSENMTANRLESNTEVGFAAWMDEYLDGRLGQAIEKKTLALDYQLAQGYDKPVQSNRWHRWLLAYCEARRLRMKDERQHCAPRVWIFQPIS